jgi:hypothetical protein
MNLASRLEKLEASRPDATADPLARTKLAETLLSNFRRNEDQVLSAEWLRSQSPCSVLAFGMHHPLPLPECLLESLRAISNGPARTGTVASKLLEVVS